MKIQRPKYLAALQEEKLQADMVYQLQQLKARLQEEQERNARLQEERHSAAPVDVEASRAGDAAASNVVIADAGGMIEKLQEENSKIRTKNDDLKATVKALKAEVEKYKSEKEMSHAGYHVKIRQLEDTVREKEKRVTQLENDNAKLTEQVHELTANGHVLFEKKAKEKRSIFRTLGSKKEKKPEAVLLDSLTGDDDPNGSKTSDVRASERHFPKLPSMSIPKAKFWGGKSKVENGEGGHEDHDSHGEDSPNGTMTSSQSDSFAGSRNTIVKSMEVGVTGAMTNLKGKMAAVKTMYDTKASKGKRSGSKGDDSERPQLAAINKDRPIRESFNLDALPEVSLPVGWEAKVSRSTGRVYYVNRKLGKSQFERPTLASLKAQKLARQKSTSAAQL
jgi:myosin heavy subunit